MPRQGALANRVALCTRHELLAVCNLVKIGALGNFEMKNKNKATDNESIWRNPAVISALIGGSFLIFTVIIKPDFWRGWLGPNEKSQNNSGPVSEDSLKLENEEMSTRIIKLMRALEKKTGDEPDCSTRQKAIAALVLMGDENASDVFHKKAVDILVEYVRKNIDERRKPGNCVEKDPPGPPFRPKDIILALKALREFRRFSKEKIPIRLGGIDFRQINLARLDLEGFYFAHADFSYGILSDCLCRGADFRHAKFYGTAIWGTKANEKTADFQEANFLKADLSMSKWANVYFTGSNIELAVGHEQVGLMADYHGLTPLQRKLFRLK